MAEVYDIVIIGSGPAGLTAGIYCGRANLKTVVIGGENWGGQLMLTTDVENFPGFAQGVAGPKLMAQMREQSERFGGKVMEENVTEVDFSNSPFMIKTSKGEYAGRAVIVATGAAAKWLGLPSEQKLVGRGVSSCAPCDAPFFKDKKVAVVGGGDAAMEEALTLTKFASEVFIVHRRAEFKASKIMQERVLAHEKIKVIWNSEVTEVLGETRVAGVRLKDVSTGEVKEMAIDGLFVAIGHTPATKIFEGKLDVDEKYYLKRVGLAEKYKTMSNVAGVFVSGDVHDYHYRQAVTAAGYGCMAAMDASRWLEEQGIGKGAALR